ncbi:MAG: hypothetical protein EZS28_026038, partial [Streblomastix strix]
MSSNKKSSTNMSLSSSQQSKSKTKSKLQLIISNPKKQSNAMMKFDTDQAIMRSLYKSKEPSQVSESKVLRKKTVEGSRQRVKLALERAEPLYKWNIKDIIEENLKGRGISLAGDAEDVQGQEMPHGIKRGIFRKARGEKEYLNDLRLNIAMLIDSLKFEQRAMMLGGLQQWYNEQTMSIGGSESAPEEFGTSLGWNADMGITEEDKKQTEKEEQLEKIFLQQDQQRTLKRETMRSARVSAENTFKEQQQQQQQQQQQGSTSQIQVQPSVVDIPQVIEEEVDDDDTEGLETTIPTEEMKDFGTTLHGNGTLRISYELSKAIHSSQESLSKLKTLKKKQVEKELKEQEKKSKLKQMQVDFDYVLSDNTNEDDDQLSDLDSDQDSIGSLDSKQREKIKKEKSEKYKTMADQITEQVDEAMNNFAEELNGTWLTWVDMHNNLQTLRRIKETMEQQQQEQEVKPETPIAVADENLSQMDEKEAEYQENLQKKKEELEYVRELTKQMQLSLVELQTEINKQEQKRQLLEMKYDQKLQRLIKQKDLLWMNKNGDDNQDGEQGPDNLAYMEYEKQQLESKLKRAYDRLKSKNQEIRELFMQVSMMGQGQSNDYSDLNKIAFGSMDFMPNQLSLQGMGMEEEDLTVFKSFMKKVVKLEKASQTLLKMRMIDKNKDSGADNEFNPVQLFNTAKRHGLMARMNKRRQSGRFNNKNDDNDSLYEEDGDIPVGSSLFDTPTNKDDTSNAFRIQMTRRKYILEKLLNETKSLSEEQNIWDIMMADDKYAGLDEYEKKEDGSNLVEDNIWTNQASTTNLMSTIRNNLKITDSTNDKSKLKTKFDGDQTSTDRKQKKLNEKSADGQEKVEEFEWGNKTGKIKDKKTDRSSKGKNKKKLTDEEENGDKENKPIKGTKVIGNIKSRKNKGNKQDEQQLQSKEDETGRSDADKKKKISEQKFFKTDSVSRINKDGFQGEDESKADKDKKNKIQAESSEEMKKIMQEIQDEKELKKKKKEKEKDDNEKSGTLRSDGKLSQQQQQQQQQQQDKNKQKSPIIGGSKSIHKPTAAASAYEE